MANVTPACLRPVWLENPYRLVSLWDMLTFDTGRLCNAIGSLSGLSLSFSNEVAGNPVLGKTKLSMDNKAMPVIQNALTYCEEAGFVMAAMPLRRALELHEQNNLDVNGFVQLAGNAMERLRDEANMVKLLRIQPERVKFYESQQPFGPEVADRFPSISFDATEASKCLALYRSTACVFHLMRVLEIGLVTLAARFGINASHSNWHNVIEHIEKAVRDIPNDPKKSSDWKEEQEFFSQSASHFMMFKDAWRNYAAHARGKFTEDEAETIMISVRAFMQKLSTRLHE